MFNKISTIRPYSINNSQEFMWVAEYLNGTLQSEFEMDDNVNSFADIKKSDLINFGIVGCGHNMFYEVPTGKFNIDGNVVDIIYKTNEKEYNLTNQFVLYNDVIQFKECWSNFNTLTDRDTHATRTTIASYNFGYKVKLNIDGNVFSLKAVCTIPYNSSAYINFRLVCSEDMDGVLVIKKNGFSVTEFQAPLKENFSGEVDWVIR